MAESSTERREIPTEQDLMKQYAITDYKDRVLKYVSSCDLSK